MEIKNIDIWQIIKLIVLVIGAIPFIPLFLFPPFWFAIWLVRRIFSIGDNTDNEFID